MTRFFSQPSEKKKPKNRYNEKILHHFTFLVCWDFRSARVYLDRQPEAGVSLNPDNVRRVFLHGTSLSFNDAFTS